LRITLSDINPLLKAFKEKGVRAVIVGSIGWRGWSNHDADIVIYFPTKVKSRQMQKWDGYQDYVDVMNEQGFKCEPHKGMTMEVWYKGKLKVDILGIPLPPDNSLITFMDSHVDKQIKRKRVKRMKKKGALYQSLGRF
jgi:hypothetical protein